MSVPHKILDKTIFSAAGFVSFYRICFCLSKYKQYKINSVDIQTQTLQYHNTYSEFTSANDATFNVGAGVIGRSFPKNTHFDQLKLFLCQEQELPASVWTGLFILKPILFNQMKVSITQTAFQ